MLSVSLHKFRFKVYDFHMLKIKNIIVTLFLSTIISACAGLQPDPEIDLYLKGAVEKLKGQSASQILECAGLPSAAVDIDDERQVLTYTNITTRIESDPLHNHNYYGCPIYFHSYYCGPYDHALFGHNNWVDVVQKGCRVGFWMKDTKVEDVSFEITSSRAKKHCARIINACVSPKQGASGDATNTQLRSEASEILAEPKSDSNSGNL